MPLRVNGPAPLQQIVPQEYETDLCAKSALETPCQTPPMRDAAMFLQETVHNVRASNGSGGLFLH